MINRVRRALLSFLCLISFFLAAFSQVDVVSTAVPFLLISPSPEGNGQGGASVARISDDPYIIISNPAQLGRMSQGIPIHFTFYSPKTDWLPGLGLSGVTYDSKVVCGSVNLRDGISLPVTVGIAYSRVDLNLGTFNRTSSVSADIIGTFNAEEHADAYSIGLGMDFGIQISLGTTFRRTVSNLADYGTETMQGSGKATIWSQDFGLLLDLPLAEFVFGKSMNFFNTLTPIINLSFGTALTNVGGKVSYGNIAQADPLPRTISVGSALEGGFKWAETDLRLFTFSWTRQAANLLVGREGASSYYRGGFGDIDFFKNIIEGKRTSTIELSQGWQVGFAEIIYIRGGSFAGTGNLFYSTSGSGLRASGLFKLLRSVSSLEQRIVSLLIDHFDIAYDQSQYTTDDPLHPLRKTNFSSLHIILRL